MHHPLTRPLLAATSLLLATLSLAGCGEDASSQVADTSAQSEDDASSTDDRCCPVDAPSCHGDFRIGGSRRLNGNQCPLGPVDAAPSSTNISYSIDSDGCRVMYVGAESCLSRPDASHDLFDADLSSNDTSSNDDAPSSDTVDNAATDTPTEDASWDDTADADANPPPPPDPNAGWIGGPCQQADECDYVNALCLSEYPGGQCSLACDRFCPDQAGNSGTFCLSTAAGGRCVSRCDWDAYPRGCRDGYTCRIMPRHNDASTRAEACVRDDHPDYVNLQGCLATLDSLGLVWGHWRYTPQSPSGSTQVCTVQQPIWLSGRDVNGVAYRYYSQANPTSMSMACALAPALHALSDVAKAQGLVDVLHIGTFNCRFIGGTTTLSRHAFGDAIDIYGFTTASGERYTLLDHWEHDTTNPVSTPARTLYEVAQQMYTRMIFNIILTPNYNAAHDNHFHVDLTPGSRFMKAEGAGDPTAPLEPIDH